MPSSAINKVAKVTTCTPAPGFALLGSWGGPAGLRVGRGRLRSCYDQALLHAYHTPGAWPSTWQRPSQQQHELDDVVLVLQMKTRRRQVAK